MANNLLTLASPENSGISLLAIFILIVFVILAITAIHFYYTSQESFKLGIRIPGPTPIPILGNALLALNKTPNGKYTVAYCALQMKSEFLV